jgi:hypothetical protein
MDVKVTAGDGTPGSPIRRARIRKDMELPSLPVTTPIRPFMYRIKSSIWDLSEQHRSNYSESRQGFRYTPHPRITLSSVYSARVCKKTKVRAVVRIGELSRALETDQPRGDSGRLASSGNTAKSRVLREAGISTSAAHRAEQLANPRCINRVNSLISKYSVHSGIPLWTSSLVSEGMRAAA